MRYIMEPKYRDEASHLVRTYGHDRGLLVGAIAAALQRVAEQAARRGAGGRPVLPVEDTVE